MKKKFSKIVLVSMVLVAMIGCEKSQATEEKSDEPLEVWVRDWYFDLVSEAASVFTERTGIQVNVSQPASMSDDLAMAISSNTTPDIVSIDCVFVPYYASIGALLDVTEEFNALEFKDTFSGGLINLAQYDGAQYAVPFSPDLSVLIYNKDIFEEVGLDPESPPQTWEELIAVAKACTTEDRYGYVYAAADAGGMMFTFGPYIWSNGGDFTTNGGTESALNSPEVAGAVQFITDMVYEHEVTPESITSYTWSSCIDAFKSGKAAMIVLGSAAVGDIVNDAYGFEAGCALIPSADGKNFSSFSGGDSIAILAATDKKEEAWQFIEFCLSEEVQVDLLAAQGYVPARTDLYENDIYAGHPEYKVLQEALKVGQAPYSIKYNEMYMPWLDALQFALNREKTVEEALSDAKKEIDRILSE